MTASPGPSHNRYKLRRNKGSLSYGRSSLIRLISFMSLVMGQCVCDTPSGFTIPKFENLANFSYKSPRDSDGRPIQISADTLLLTPDPIATVTLHELHYIGRIVYNQAFQFIPSDGSSSSKEVSSFSSSLTFKILTTSFYGSCGDGLAFFITSDFEPPLNSTGRYLGLQSQLPSSPAAPKTSSSFFAVEFDTFQNLDFGDPSASHMAFDISSLNSSAILDTSGNNSCCREMKNKDENPGQCPFCDELHHRNQSGVQSQYDNKDRADFVKSSYPELFLYNNYTFTAWIQYDAPTHLLQLWMTNQSTAQRPPDPCLSMIYNLSKIFLPQMYVGISAASGNNFEGTTIYSWNFTLHGNESKAKNLKVKANRHKKMLTVVFIVITMLIVAGVAVCIRLVVAKSRKRTRKTLKKRRTLERLPHIQIELIAVPRYSYKSLKRAAHSFRERNKVGEGGFSSVYKGELEDGRQVAVKKLKKGVTMEAEFASEVQTISQIRHRNLLQLQGWCYEKGEALFVYQIMPNGSLDSYLFGSKRESHSLDSETRFKVLTGVAAALEYLHNGLGGCVLHRDVKAANVLLTDKFEPMLGDFGLARLISHDQVVTMRAAGTPGYVAPEVIYTGKATNKADVYGFGVLALEVACGHRVLDSSFDDEHLSNWVWSLQQNGNIMNALDPNLNLNFSCSNSQACAKKEGNNGTSKHRNLMQLESLELTWRCVLHLGLLCCHPYPDARPTMRQVHQALEESILFPLPPSRPMYGTSYDLSELTLCTLSLDHSGPPVSEQSTSSPSNDYLLHRCNKNK